jgi:hypothetical protein
MALLSFLNILKADPNKAMDLADKAMGSIASGLDKLHYSEQEKSQMSLDTGKLVLDIHRANNDQNSIRSRTRRWLAVLIVGHFLAFLDIAALVYWRTEGTVEEKIIAAKFFLGIAFGTLGTLAITVSIFYFGYYAISNVVGKIKGKK